MSNLNKLNSAKIKNIKPSEKEITLSDGGNFIFESDRMVEYD